MNTDRFKFRAWSIEEKKYYLDIEYTYADDYKNCSFVPNTQNVDEHYNFGGILDDPGYIVEQCTGVKDKNGKLIFEGDVVKTKDFGKDIDNRINVNDYDTFVVKFHECGFYIENDSRRFPMSCRPKLEIIGNIHEMEIEK